MVDEAVLDDRWIIRQRGPRNAVDPSRPYAYLVEPERTAEGRIEDVATVFITNKECPFRCLMCDLWKNTTEDRVKNGSVARQIEWALKQLPPAPHVKLYNSGNFFDEQAVSRGDRSRIAELVSRHRTVIVECHPRLVDRRCLEFADSIEPALQVAMGLETVDPHVLPRLNKRMTLEDYERATQFLLDQNIRVRAFILLRTPFQSETEGVKWAMRSIDHAFSIGVECCAVIPTRGGNGAMEWLQQRGYFHPPSLRSMETVLEYGVGRKHGRVFMDLWDIERFYDCPRCSPARAKRLAEMNLSQEVSPKIPACPDCDLAHDVTGLAPGAPSRGRKPTDAAARLSEPKAFPGQEVMNRAAVIFDLDGTLTEPYLDFDAIRDEIGAQGPILEAMVEMDPASRQRAEAILLRYERGAAENATLQEGAVEVVDACRAKGYPVAILTRNARATVNIVLAKCGITVDALRTREDGAIKPSAQPLLSICDELCADPRCSWMVGDYLFDILSGQAAGTRTVLMIGDRARPEFAERADYVIRRLAELLMILDRRPHRD